MTTMISAEELLERIHDLIDDERNIGNGSKASHYIDISLLVQEMVYEQGE